MNEEKVILSLENNLPTFRLNAPVIMDSHPDDDWSIQSKHSQVFFQAQVGTR